MYDRCSDNLLDDLDAPELEQRAVDGMGNITALFDFVVSLEEHHSEKSTPYDNHAIVHPLKEPLNSVKFGILSTSFPSLLTVHSEEVMMPIASPALRTQNINAHNATRHTEEEIREEILSRLPFLQPSFLAPAYSTPWFASPHPVIIQPCVLISSPQRERENVLRVRVEDKSAPTKLMANFSHGGYNLSISDENHENFGASGSAH